MEVREMLDHDPISEFEEEEKADIPLIAIDKAKAEAMGEQQRKTQKEAPKPVAPFGGGGAAGSSAAVSKKPSGTETKVRDKTASKTKVSQNTSRSD